MGVRKEVGTRICWALGHGLSGPWEMPTWPCSLRFRLDPCLPPTSHLPDSHLPGMPCPRAFILLGEPLPCLGPIRPVGLAFADPSQGVGSPGACTRCLGFGEEQRGEGVLASFRILLSVGRLGCPTCLCVLVRGGLWALGCGVRHTSLLCGL